MRRFLVRLGATFLFTGHFPVAPATFASFVTLAIWWWLQSHQPIPPLVMLAVIAAVTAIGIPLASRAEPIYGHDGKPIVIDEVAGALLTVAWMGSGVDPLKLAVAGFLVFRVLDVVKPPPAYQLQSLPRGWGVMMDDIMAAIYGNLFLRLLMLLWPTLLAPHPAR
jgi:phosphatidylglycerophosphatase A